MLYKNKQVVVYDVFAAWKVIEIIHKTYIFAFGVFVIPIHLLFQMHSCA